MDKIAGIDELTALFETDPKLIDPDAPWPYGAVVFETSRDGFDVEFHFHASASRIVMRLAGRTLVDLAVDGGAGLEVFRELGRELLILRPRSGSITLTLRPDVALAVEL